MFFEQVRREPHIVLCSWDQSQSWIKATLVRLMLFMSLFWFNKKLGIRIEKRETKRTHQTQNRRYQMRGLTSIIHGSRKTVTSYFEEKLETCNYSCINKEAKSEMCALID